MHLKNQTEAITYFEKVKANLRNGSVYYNDSLGHPTNSNS